MNTKRVIFGIYVSPHMFGEAKALLVEQGRHPRSYERQVRAENKSLRVWVIVADPSKSGAPSL